MLENLALRGIKRQVRPPMADIETCKTYRPGDVGRLVTVMDTYGLATGAIFMKGIVPDWLISAYRDAPNDSQVTNSPHYFAAAFDVKIGSVMKQIEFIKLAIRDMQLFNRGGIYVGRNTCHIDTCDDTWIKKYRGAKFWVWHKGKYCGFFDFNGTARYALDIVANGGNDA